MSSGCAPKAYHALLDETRPYTLSVTFKPEAALRTSKGDHTLIAKEYLGGKEVILRVEKGKYQFGYNTGANQIVSLPVPEEDVGAWVTLTGVYDGASLRLYRNGALAAEGVPAAAPIANAGRWTVGYNPAFANRQFLGTIGRAALWQRALSAREVAVLADGGEAAFAALSGGAQTPPLAVGLTVHRPDTLAPMTGGGVLLGDRTLLDERVECQWVCAVRLGRLGKCAWVRRLFEGRVVVDDEAMGLFKRARAWRRRWIRAGRCAGGGAGGVRWSLSPKYGREGNRRWHSAEM